MTEIQLTTKFVDESARAEWGVYTDGSLALRFTSLENGYPLATATVCLVDYNVAPAPGNIFIKDYSENEGMYECLKATGVVGEAIRQVGFGYRNSCTAYECPLLVEATL